MENRAYSGPGECETLPFINSYRSKTLFLGTAALSLERYRFSKLLWLKPAAFPWTLRTMLLLASAAAAHLIHRSEHKLIN